MPEQSLQNMNETTSDDILYAIKENLETENILSTSVISHLHNSHVNLESIFSHLTGVLNVEEVLHFGSSLKSEVVNNDIISCYVRHLLLKKLSEEFSEQLQSTFNEFCKKYPSILKVEISSILMNTKESCSKVFLQFLDGLADEFKSSILKNFIFSCEDLQLHHISLIDILLNSQVEIESLNKLVEIMSFAADKYTTEKTFGKLLMNALKLLGKNVALLEKPLNHIIASHRSVWKSKIQKIFDENFEDNSMVMTQSFRF
nr:uncharacterized protein LOC111511231 [Leptinotarsa decemlineata]